MKKITKSTINVPILELHNQYYLRGYQVDYKTHEQIILEVLEK